MQYVSIREVMDRLLIHPLLQDVGIERVILYAIDLMKLLNVPPSFIDKIAEIEIEKHKGVLPSDLFTVNQVRYKKDNFVLAAATDTFHLADEDKEHYIYPCYKIQGKYIYTSSLDKTIEISYKAIIEDCDGFPLIPDNTSFIKALEAYVKEQQFTILFDMDKISEKALLNAKKEYSWYAGQAQTSMLMPSIDEMASITNMWNQLIPRTRQHANQFKTLGLQERINKW